MTLQDIYDRLDRREYTSEQARDFVRSALIGLIDGAMNEGHAADVASSCFICQALGEMVAVDDIMSLHDE